MPARRLLEDSEGEAEYTPYINTGTPLDIMSGKYIPSINGTWALSGSLGPITAGIAEANKYKSTVINGGLVCGLARFPESELYLKDSENSVDKPRLSNMSNMYHYDQALRAEHIKDIQSRIHLYNTSTERAKDLDSWVDFMKELRDKKVKDAKNWEVETELLDVKTGKPLRMLVPTFVGIDSWTEAMVAQLNVRNEEIDADTEMSKQRTIFMEEAWKKGQLMRQLPRICAQGGIYLGITGHLGKKISMDGKPVKKDMAYFKQDETTKSMSSKFLFLMNGIFKIDNIKQLVDKNDPRESDYPSDLASIAGNELNQLMISLPRSKNTLSGYQTLLVASQRFGILPGLSYYNYLRENKYYGLGTPNKVRNPLLGDLNIGRTKIFDLAMGNYKVQRALELTYELAWIQDNWTFLGQPVDYSISIDDFASKLQQSGYAIDDILNSRGWWTQLGMKGGDFDRPYLTLPDILMIINGSYKPKLFAVTN